MGSYRALISVPISAEDSEDAFEIAAEYADSLKHPDSEVIAGHVEMVVNSDDEKIMYEAASFRRLHLLEAKEK